MSEISDQENMPDTSDSESQLLTTTEYKSGELQIVDVRPLDKDNVEISGEVSGSLPDLELDGQTKYIQLLNPNDKSLMQLDLLNLTLVKCEDGTESYRLVANEDETSVDDSGTTFTCVLASSDNENTEESDMPETYVMMENEQDPLMMVRTSHDQDESGTVHYELQIKEENKITPHEILERAKAIQKSRSLMKSLSHGPSPGRGRKRKSTFPPPHELLASPNFKLFLYSCQLCTFKCNAVKEMTAHRTAEHNGGKAKWRGRNSTATLQCARCPYKGTTHTQLMKHVQDLHNVDNRVYLNTEEVAAADVLVCGACGFESAARSLFRTHVEQEHGATAC